MRSEDSGERSFGALDHFALWASLGVSLYLMPFGSLLVPALSLEQAILAAVVAAFLGALLIASVAALAARTGLSAVALLGRLFGERATPAVALLLLLRNVLWGAFALALIADSAGLVSARALGAGLRPLWTVAFGLVALALLWAGPEFVVRRLLRRAGVWLVLLVAVVVTLSAYLEFGIPAYLQRPATGGWPSFWQAVDVMLVVPLLWLPLVPDYARFGRSAAGAAGGSFAGSFIATVWFGVLGIVYLPAVETGDIAGFVVGMQVGLGALVLLLVLQVDEVFAGGYSAALALRALVPLSQRAASAALGLLLIGLALLAGILEREAYLLLIGSLFVPLFGVLLADQLLARPAEGTARAAVPLAAWLLGFLVYQWISPADVGWWADAVEFLFADTLRLPFPLTDEVTWLGAAVPSLFVGFLAHLLGTTLLRARRMPAAAEASG